MYFFKYQCLPNKIQNHCFLISKELYNSNQTKIKWLKLSKNVDDLISKVMIKRALDTYVAHMDLRNFEPDTLQHEVSSFPDFLNKFLNPDMLCEHLNDCYPYLSAGSMPNHIAFIIEKLVEKRPQEPQAIQGLNVLDSINYFYSQEGCYSLIKAFLMSGKKRKKKLVLKIVIRKKSFGDSSKQ